MKRLLRIVLWLNLFLSAALIAAGFFFFYNQQYVARAFEYAVNKKLAAAGIEISSIESLVLNRSSLEVESMRIEFKLSDASYTVRNLKFPFRALFDETKESIPQPLEFNLDFSAGEKGRGFSAQNVATKLFIKEKQLNLSLAAPLVKIWESEFKDVRSEAKIKPGEKRAEISLGNINLASVFSLYPDSGVAGEGALDLKAPLKYGDGKYEIKGGEFKSRGAGFIKVPLSESAENPQLNFAAKALSNFQYEVLNGTVALSPAGDLKLGVHLEGRSAPTAGGLNNAQPVNVNINVEENLPMLFKSLSIGKRLTESMGK